MKIIEIHIYGYGKLENLIIKNLSQFQVFYGENEAGKSTIMSFIHSVLFGFPTKQQSELRYEPKIHAKYGGKLVVQHPLEGKVVIERVKGKAIGDVIVSLEDGTSGGEELLAKIIKNIDKSMYQSIFSFNLNGLQNIQQVKSEDLGKFLFSTGAVGTDKLLKVENELKKELENRFKPGGKKPIINEKLKELQELEWKLKEAQKKNNDYTSLIQKRMNLEESIKTNQLEMKQLQTNINRLKEMNIHLPSAKELLMVYQELEQTSTIHFPVDGMKRFEAVEQLIKPLETQLVGLQTKQEKLTGQLALIKISPQLIEQEVEVDAAISKLLLDDRLAAEKAEMKVQIETLQFQINQLKEKLYYSIDEQQLSNVDTSIFMKEKIGQIQSMAFRLSDQKQMLDNRFQEEKTILEQIEKEITYLEEQQLSEQARESIIRQWKQATELEQVKLDLKEVQSKIDYHRISKKTEKSQSDKSKGQTIFLFVLFLFLAIWSGLNQQWIILVITSVSFLYLSIVYIKKTYLTVQVRTDDLIADLFEKEKQLLAKISATKDQDSMHLQAKLHQDDNLREKIQSAKLRWGQQQVRYEQVIRAYEEWEQETKSNDFSLKEVYHQLNLSNQIPWKQLADAFEIITDLKDMFAEFQRLQNRIKQVEEKRSEIYSSISLLAERFLSEKETSLTEMVIGLKEALKEARQNTVESDSIRVKARELETDLFTMRNELGYLKGELQQLLQEADCNNEEEFRSKANKAIEIEALLFRKRTIESQLKSSGYSLEEFQEFEQDSQLNNQITEWNHQMNTQEELIIKQQNEWADIKHQISLLEEGGTYTELLHRYKHLKYELEEQASNWGAYAVAKHLLSKTIEKYKNEKLPTLLKKAEDYLSYLTNETYIRIHAKEKDESGFVIERKDHTFFEANELSQATMEQVYVSIRLALATTLFEKHRFPIIIDDSFVNFDHIRLERVLKLLSNIKDHQVLFFTCHSHLLNYFSQNQLIELGENEELLSK
jgi:uncharacterized protein YhaN